MRGLALRGFVEVNFAHNVVTIETYYEVEPGLYV